MLCGGFLSVFIRVHLWPILCPRYRPKGNLHLVPLLLPFAGAAAPQTWTLANGQVAGTISFTPESGSGHPAALRSRANRFHPRQPAHGGGVFFPVDWTLLPLRELLGARRANAEAPGEPAGTARFILQSGRETHFQAGLGHTPFECRVGSEHLNSRPFRGPDRTQE